MSEVQRPDRQSRHKILFIILARTYVQKSKTKMEVEIGAHSRAKQAKDSLCQWKEVVYSLKSNK